MGTLDLNDLKGLAISMGLLLFVIALVGLFGGGRRK